jgi:hypothetical protein
LVGCILAYRTRDLDSKYGEAKQLGTINSFFFLYQKVSRGITYIVFARNISVAFSMYNIAFTGLITILIICLVELDQISRIVVQTVSVLWGSCFCSLAFVLPRLLQVQKDYEVAKSQLSSKLKYSGTASSLANNINSAPFQAGHSFQNGTSTMHSSSDVPSKFDTKQVSPKCYVQESFSLSESEANITSKVDRLDEYHPDVGNGLDINPMNTNADTNMEDTHENMDMDLTIVAMNYRQRTGTMFDSVHSSGS